MHPILPLSTYRIFDIEKAFRTLQTGKSMGKIVVVPNEGDQAKVTKNTLSAIIYSSLIVHSSGCRAQDQFHSPAT